MNTRHMTIMPSVIHIFIIMDFELYIAVPPKFFYVWYSTPLKRSCQVLFADLSRTQIHNDLSKDLGADQKLFKDRKLVGPVHVVVRPRHGRSEGHPVL